MSDTLKTKPKKPAAKKTKAVIAALKPLSAAKKLAKLPKKAAPLPKLKDTAPQDWSAFLGAGHRVWEPSPERARALTLPNVEQASVLPLHQALAEPLHEMLKRSRASGSIAEAQAAAWVVSWASRYATLTMVDETGNLHFRLGESRTIFAAHLDTVAYVGGPNPYCLDDKWLRAKGEVLGADDGAGVAILCWMLANGIPGRYIFTRGEESGGVGSRHITKSYKAVLENYDRTVCFDRKGKDEVIYVQGGQVCASDSAAWDLCEQLNKSGLSYGMSELGSFTDSKIFSSVVPECYNVSVGYEHEHGDDECLDLTHLQALADAVLLVEWEKLPVERDPKVPQSFYGAGATKNKLFSLEDKELADLDEAVNGFLDGQPYDLETILAEYLYPDDIEAGRRFIDMKRLTPEQADATSRMGLNEMQDFLLGIVMLAEAKA